VSDSVRPLAESVPPLPGSARTGDLVRLGEIDALVLAALHGGEESRLALLVEPDEAAQVRKALRGMKGIRAAPETQALA